MLLAALMGAGVRVEEVQDKGERKALGPISLEWQHLWMRLWR